MYMLNHIIARSFRCEVLPRVAGKLGYPQEMLMRFSTIRQLAALAVALTVSSTALSQSVPVRGSALAPPPFSIIHAGTLLAVPGKQPLSKATIAVEKGSIKVVRRVMWMRRRWACPLTRRSLID